MVIPQFGMINAFLRYRWSDKGEKVVVYSISILGASSFSSTSLRSSKFGRLKDEDLF